MRRKVQEHGEEESLISVMACCVLTCPETLDSRAQVESVELEIIGGRKPCRICKEIKIKTEILDEIERFSASEELDFESEEEAGRQLGNSKVSREREGTGSVSKCEVPSDEYVDFEECITALTTGNRLMCTVCRIEFPREAEFQTHMIGHSHGKLFQCGFCGKQFSESTGFKSHLQLHIIRQGYSYNQRFEKRAKLKGHQSEAREERRTFECKVCKKKLLHRQSLRDHNLMHRNVKPFECGNCKKRFLRSSSLRAHMIVHTALSPFVCDQCPARFKRSSVLKTHKLTHTTERKFECDICKHRFHLKGALKHHILAHYGVRPYKCEDCGKCYRRSWGLKVHRYRHTGVRRFECDLCKSRFTIKTKLAKHIYGHMGEKPYKCQVCGRQYGERYQLKGHKCNAPLIGGGGGGGGGGGRGSSRSKTFERSASGEESVTQIVFFHLGTSNKLAFNPRAAMHSTQ